MSAPLLERLRAALAADRAQATSGWLAREAAEAALSSYGTPLDRALDELRREGYVIEEDPEMGLKLRSEPDVLSAENLTRDLGARIVGRDIRVFDLVISTSDVVWQLADQGAEEGTAVFAEEQTRGRGRLGRSWWSPRGKGIWMSVLLRPPVTAETVPMTTIIGALAAAEAILATTRLPARIRWPNDVVVERKKVAGALVEARQAAGGRELVLGIGVDVNIARRELPEEIAHLATSLSEAAGERINRLELARELLRRLDRWYQVELEQDIEAINERWRALSATLGEWIVLDEEGRRYEGTVADVDVRFGLALRLSRGNIRHFRGEHVTVIQHG